MTQPPRKRGPKRTAQNQKKRSRRFVGIVLGLLLACLGFYLFAMNYENSPKTGGMGLILLLVGAVTVGVSAFLRDRLNPPPNGNGSPGA